MVTVPIAFLDPKKVLQKLSLGESFKLWEGKIIADGVVEKVMNS
jgi:hypothetical protein